MRTAKWRWLVLGLLMIASLGGAVVLSSCGDGEKCDCCDDNTDCEFPLQCVELQGGSGKVCGEAGVNYCYNTSC